ncbi:Conserved_hypothetical protein [Hexamita inflata]|uniref:Uncharacterized protein n=1 Tax=Hexamita inflata TaxID=28002 RepID=A0AA86NT54_9EUKA|nr:Conserved hypothetical protein [Hexamita inflata]
METEIFNTLISHYQDMRLSQAQQDLQNELFKHIPKQPNIQQVTQKSVFEISQLNQTNDFDSTMRSSNDFDSTIMSQSTQKPKNLKQLSKDPPRTLTKQEMPPQSPAPQQKVNVKQKQLQQKDDIEQVNVPKPKTPPKRQFTMRQQDIPKQKLEPVDKQQIISQTNKQVVPSKTKIQKTVEQQNDYRVNETPSQVIQMKAPSQNNSEERKVFQNINNQSGLHMVKYNNSEVDNTNQLPVNQKVASNNIEMDVQKALQLLMGYSAHLKTQESQNAATSKDSDLVSEIKRIQIQLQKEAAEKANQVKLDTKIDIKPKQEPVEAVKPVPKPHSHHKQLKEQPIDKSQVQIVQLQRMPKHFIKEQVRHEEIPPRKPQQHQNPKKHTPSTPPLIIREIIMPKQPQIKRKKQSDESMAAIIAAEIHKVIEEHNEIEGNKTVPEQDLRDLSELVQNTHKELNQKPVQRQKTMKQEPQNDFSQTEPGEIWPKYDAKLAKKLVEQGRGLGVYEDSIYSDWELEGEIEEGEIVGLRQ